MTVLQFYNGTDKDDLFKFGEMEMENPLSKNDFYRKYRKTSIWNAEIIRVETKCGKYFPAIHIITI